MTLSQAITLYVAACRDHDTATAHEYYEVIRSIRHREETPVTEHESLCYQVAHLEGAA